MNKDDRLEQLEKRVAALEKEIAELKRKTAPFSPQAHSKAAEQGAQNGSIGDEGQLWQDGHSAHSVPAPLASAAGQAPDRLPNNRPIGSSPYLPPLTDTGRLDQRVERDWEHLIARVWLPRIFMFVLLIGLIWGFKAAADAGYLTEGLQCILGYAAAGLFVIAGYRQHKANRPLLAQVLLAGSIGILMLTTFAAHYLYAFLNAPAAFAANVIWVLLGLWFSHKLQSEALGILAIAAGVLTPFLVQMEKPSALFIVGYETVLYAGFMVYAIQRRYVKLFYTSFGLLHFAFILISSMASQVHKIVALGAIAQHLILLAAVFLLEGLKKQQRPSLVASFALTSLWFKIAMSENDFELFMLLLFAGYSLLSWISWKKQRDDLPHFLTAASYSILFYTANAIEHKGLPAVVMLEGLIAIWLGFAVRSLMQRINGLLIYLFGILTAAAVLSDGMDSVLSYQMLTWLVLFASLSGIAALVAKHRVGSSTSQWLGALYYTIGILFLIFLTELTSLLTEGLSRSVRHLFVSAAWSAYSVCVIAFGVVKSKKQVRLAGIALLFLTLAKVILFDLPAVSVLVKSVLFIGLGGIGIFLSRWFYRKQ